MITFEQAKTLSSVWVIATNPHKKNKVCQLRRNGAPKLWKTRPNDIRVPYKYGLYEYGYFGSTGRDCDWTLADCYATEDECNAALQARIDSDGESVIGQARQAL